VEEEMPADLPEKLNIVVASPRAVSLDQIRAVAPDRLNVIDGFADLYPEIEKDWQPRVIQQLIGTPPVTKKSEAEREELISSAHVMLFSMPYPMSMAPRAKNLRWVHFTSAGPVRLHTSPWARGPVPMTTSRGLSSPVPIGETTVAAAMMLARRLDRAAINTAKGFDVTYQPPSTLVQGKTMGIIGLGGIGAEIAKLSRAVGMKVIATKWSAKERQLNVEGVDELLPASGLMEMLPRCDFVAIAAPWTPETEKMMGAAQLAAMKPGAYLLNVARGALTDEDALINALKSGQLGGAYIDTWWDETERAPREDLIAAPNLVITPHTSGRSDMANSNLGVELFCDNLRRLLDGQPLENVFDWDKGY
jgi:phosphoglycerate dehydrogenase-like enzyme